jgi:peptidoglycan/LPS O-acetylase OafA/YrhL
VFLPAMLLIVVAGAISTATGFGTDSSEWRKFDVWHFTTNLLMLSGVRQVAAHLVTFSFMEQSWTLNYEYFFYILFGTAVLSVRGRSGLVVKVVIFAAIMVLTMQLPHRAVIVLALTWGLGVLISRLLMAGRTRSASCTLLVALAALLVAVPLELGHFGERLVLIIFMASATFFLVVNADRFIPPPWLQAAARNLAGFSYSLYLLHILLYWALFGANPAPVEWAQATFGSFVTAVALLVLINVAAWTFSLATERHTNAVREMILSLRSRQPSASSPRG